jgi:hypothetical protein
VTISILIAVFSALASAGFASIATSRFRLAAESYRLGNRLELIRSSLLGVVMSVFAIGAAYGTLLRAFVVASRLSH